VYKGRRVGGLLTKIRRKNKGGGKALAGKGNAVKGFRRNRRENGEKKRHGNITAEHLNRRLQQNHGIKRKGKPD